MSDLVERLRNYNPPDRTVDEQQQISKDIHEAADEIESLRASISRTQAQCVDLIVERNKARAERDALQEYCVGLEQTIRDNKFAELAAKYLDERDALKKVVEEARELIALELRDYHTGLNEAESEAWQARAKALLSREETK
jgi:uncharacterized coiled-coil DUF342 family protein